MKVKGHNLPDLILLPKQPSPRRTETVNILTCCELFHLIISAWLIIGSFAKSSLRRKEGLEREKGGCFDVAFMEGLFLADINFNRFGFCFYFLVTSSGIVDFSPHSGKLCSALNTNYEQESILVRCLPPLANCIPWYPISRGIGKPRTYPHPLHKGPGTRETHHPCGQTDRAVIMTPTEISANAFPNYLSILVVTFKYCADFPFIDGYESNEFMEKHPSFPCRPWYFHRLEVE